MGAMAMLSLLITMANSAQAEGSWCWWDRINQLRLLFLPAMHGVGFRRHQLLHAEWILSKLSGPPYSSTLTRFARRRPGESNVVGRELHADAPVIEPHHLPIGSAPGAGERDRMPAITNGSIGILCQIYARGNAP